MSDLKQEFNTVIVTSIFEFVDQGADKKGRYKYIYMRAVELSSADSEFGMQMVFLDKNLKEVPAAPPTPISRADVLDVLNSFQDTSEARDDVRNTDLDIADGRIHITDPRAKKAIGVSIK